MKLNLCVNATSTRHAFNASMTWAIRSWQDIVCRCLDTVLVPDRIESQSSNRSRTWPQSRRCAVDDNAIGLASQRTNLPFAWQEVECDEVYVIAGHKGNQSRQKKVEQDVAVVWKSGRGTLARRNPDFRVGFNLEAEVVLKMLPNVKQATIAYSASIVPGTLIYTDEYIIYSPLSQWGMTIKVSVTARESG